LKNEDLKIAYKEADNQHKNIQFLMRELTHRVKNNLQIISSLLNIQSNYINNDAAVNALKVAKNRILTISHIENIITIEQETIHIDDFIRDVCESVISVLSDDELLKFKIDYELETIVVKNLNTTIVGLILNELITNTTKYAFDSYSPTNNLKISCKTVKNSLKLIIKDNGKGYKNSISGSSSFLGIELVKEMVEQLDGKILINSTKGTTNIIDIPINNIS
jgi:two-component sensor histidine kinase